MADEDKEDKTEDPSGRRLEQAREDGQLPRSKELATFAVTMTGVAMLMASGSMLYEHFQRILERVYTFDGKTLQDEDRMLEIFKEASFDMLIALSPMLGALLIVAAVTPLLTGGWNFTFKPIEPKFSKLNPISGVKRMFSASAALEGGKAILKSFLIGGIATWVIWNERDAILGLISEPMEQSLGHLVRLMEHTFLIVVSSMLLLVVIDVPFQIWNYHKNLRMTKEEVKQENKESSGNPEVKGRIRQLQREAARRRMMSEIPNANVIVTNPTHYAVALKYEDGMRAPVLVAKGTMILAEKIIELGKEHRVTIMRAPPFARALYHNTELGEEIPSALYSATAQVLAYVFQLKEYEHRGGMPPVYPDNLPVPAELDPNNATASTSSPAP